jgi:branched-chain amino acid transport system substrate-binding protein
MSSLVVCFGRLCLIAFVSQILAVSASAAETVKIGFMLPQTGNEASEQKILANAFNLAVKQVNAAGGIKGRKIEPVFADTKSGPQTALEAFDKLIAQSRVAAVVGPFKSAQIVAMIPKAKTAGVPTFIGGTNPRLTAEGRWFFRTRPDDSIAAEAMVRYIKENLKKTKVGIIHDNGAFGVGGANLVEKNAAAAGLKIVKRRGFDFGEKNFAAPLASMKEAGAEVMIVYAANLDESAAIEIEHAKIGKPFIYLGSPSSQSKVTIDQAKDAAEGIMAVVDFVFGSSDADKKYSADYVTEYHEEPDAISTYAYDAVMIFAKAMNAVGNDNEKIRDYILALQGYQGIQGKYNFNPQGDGLHAVTIVKVVGGKPQLAKVLAL